MMNTNENGSKRVLILVHPAKNTGGISRPSKSFQTDREALDYAVEGDAILHVFEDSTVYPMVMGAKSRASWVTAMAEAYLYSGLNLEKSQIIDLCFHEDTNTSKAFIESLVDYVVECRAEQEAGL